MTDQQHVHPEAYCLMDYESADGGIRERICNSRDGVSPFMVIATDGATPLSHVDWHNDECRPDHVPAVGDRVFVDLSRESYVRQCREWVARNWDTDTYGSGETLAQSHPGMTLDEVAEYYTEADWQPGTPDVITVTPEWLAEFEANRWKSLAESYRQALSDLRRERLARAQLQRRTADTENELADAAEALLRLTRGVVPVSTQEVQRDKLERVETAIARARGVYAGA